MVCRQLGYDGAVAAKGNAYFGEGQGYIMLDKVNCVGNETVLAECETSEWYDHTCQHNRDAGVMCATEPGKRKSYYVHQFFMHYADDFFLTFITIVSIYTIHSHIIITLSIIVLTNCFPICMKFSRKVTILRGKSVAHYFSKFLAPIL